VVFAGGAAVEVLLPPELPPESLGALLDSLGVDEVLDPSESFLAAAL
jgi:hypothetical protein